MKCELYLKTNCNLFPFCLEGNENVHKSKKPNSQIKKKLYFSGTASPMPLTAKLWPEAMWTVEWKGGGSCIDQIPKTISTGYIATNQIIAPYISIIKVKVFSCPGSSIPTLAD